MNLLPHLCLHDPKLAASHVQSDQNPAEPFPAQRQTISAWLIDSATLVFEMPLSLAGVLEVPSLSFVLSEGDGVYVFLFVSSLFPQTSSFCASNHPSRTLRRSLSPPVLLFRSIGRG